MTTDSLTARAHTHTHTLHRDNDKHEILKTGLRAWVAQCVCLVSHCSACECVWRPFSTTQGAVLTLHMTQTDLWPFYAPLNWLWHMCIHCSVCHVSYILLGCVYYTRAFMPAWVCVSLHNRMCVKRPYGSQNVVAEESFSGFENVQSGISCNRKRRMKNKEKNKDRQWNRRVCCQTGPHCTTHTQTDLHKSTCCSYKLDG